MTKLGLNLATLVVVGAGAVSAGFGVGCGDDSEASGAGGSTGGNGGSGAGVSTSNGGASASGGSSAGGSAAGGSAAGGSAAGGSAAGGGNATGGSGPTSTAGVLCQLNDSGNQQLLYDLRNGPMAPPTPVDETLPYTFAWTCDNQNRVLSGNGVPNHGVTNGVFATQLSAQNINQEVPIEPALTGEITPAPRPGYALNSVKFDPATAGTCPDTAMDDSDCNYAMGSDTWSMVATPGNVSPWRFSFGVDDNDAHVQPNGQYHYHGSPVGLIQNLNPNYTTSMTLVGWAADGFPIYAVQGYADPNDATSAIVEVASSYQTVATPAANRPSTTDFPLGHFTQDWAYVDKSGDLDECNGRFGVTPEFPNGIYHYHITNTYPFVQRCVKGTAAGGPPGP